MQNHLSNPVRVSKAEYVFHLVAIVPNSDSLQLEKNLKFLLTDQNAHDSKNYCYGRAPGSRSDCLL